MYLIKEQSIINQEENKNIDKSKTLNKDDIKIGLEIYVRTVEKNGVIVSHISKSNEVQVQIGIMKLNVNIDDLEKAHKENVTKHNKNIQTSGYTSISKSRNIKPEINVIGLNVEEAVFVVDKFLDDCSLAKLQTVRIVHGKGTGKLKNGIHQFLKKHPHVKSMRMGTYGEGEMGVTVVELI
jgi:DNA mismatch repair protein MutS2